MKQIIITFLVIVIFSSCSKTEGNDHEQIISKISNNQITYSINDFLEIGFKKTKEYNVDELPFADSAFWGFWKNNLDGPKEFEIRFYPTHQILIENGINFADEVIGKEAKLTKKHATWKEGIKDRRWGGFYLDGSIDPKYYGFIVYSNFIIFCEGREQEQSITRCSEIIKKIKK